MLVLMRRPGEAVCVGESIKITVLGVHGQQVRVGVKAPREIAVDREEVHLRKLEESRTR